MRYITFSVLWKRIKAIRFMLKDPKVSKWKKFLVFFGVVYLVMPMDLVPIMIFPFSFIDDLVLWIWILYMLKDTLDAYWVGEKEIDLSKKFKDKTVIDGVDFEVNAATAEKTKETQNE